MDIARSVPNRRQLIAREISSLHETDGEMTGGRASCEEAVSVPIRPRRRQARDEKKKETKKPSKVSALRGFFRR